MPPRGVKEGSMRERQHEHIKDSERAQGAEDEAHVDEAAHVDRQMTAAFRAFADG